MQAGALPAVPYNLARLGVIMRKDPESELEREGVLNPASARGRDGTPYLLPRLVAPGNESRIGLAKLIVDNGEPVAAARESVVLEPDAHWEKAPDHAGVEDPRVTWVENLSRYIMAYVAYGPLGPRAALAASSDLRDWQRLGPVHFEYDSSMALDLNVFDNKDVVVFPEPVRGPDGRPSYALLHRPVWDVRSVFGGGEGFVPPSLGDDRPGIWISYAPAAEVEADLSRLAHLRGHKPVAQPEFAFESLKIGAGTPPLRVPEGWLLVHHGVTLAGTGATRGEGPQGNVRYCAGAMLLDHEDPSRVIARTSGPLLEPEVAEELEGTVPNVVFPTAIETIEGSTFVFYGMADSAIGVARLRHT